MKDKNSGAGIERMPEDDPTKHLDWYLQKRGDKKRDYVFSVSRMRTCPHNHLHAMVTGGTKYRCEDCNWCFDIVTAYAQPLHNVVVGSLLQVLHFAKEFGGDNLQEVLRTPKGQHELDYHLPALPEGMTFWDAVEALEVIDVNKPDRGAGELRKLLEKHWVPLAERQRRHKELESANAKLGKLLEKHGLMAPQKSPKRYAAAIGDPSDERRALFAKGRFKLGEAQDGKHPKPRGLRGRAKGTKADGGAEVPSLPAREQGADTAHRDT